MDRIVVALDRVLEVANRIAAFSILVMAALILTEIFCRVALDYSIKLVWETGTYLLAASWFLAAGYTLRTGGHVRIALLAGKLSTSGKRFLDIVATLGGIWICGVLLASLVQLFTDSIKYNKHSFTPMQTPLWIPQLFVVIGAVLLLLAMAARLWLLLRRENPDLPFSTEK